MTLSGIWGTDLDGIFRVFNCSGNYFQGQDLIYLRHLNHRLTKEFILYYKGIITLPCLKLSSITNLLIPAYILTMAVNWTLVDLQIQLV